MPFRVARASSPVALLALASCAASQAPAGQQPVLAVFPVQARQARLGRSLVDRLHEHATRLVDQSGLYNVVPRERLLRRLKRRRRAERRCASLRCQVKLGKKLFDADKSLAIEITRNLVSQCDVVAHQRHLSERRVEQTTRDRGSCTVDGLVRTLNQVLCQTLERERQRRADDSDEPGTTAPLGCIAQADFLWVDRQLEAFGRSGAPGVRRKQRTQERQLAERLLELKRELERIARYGEARWTVAALCRTGSLYEHLAQTVAAENNAAAPPAVRRLGKAAVERHQREQRLARQQRAAPFLTKAREIYQQCLAAAREHDIDDAYTKEAGERLERLNAGKRPSR